MSDSTSSDRPAPKWEDVLHAGVRAQQLVSGCVAVGGTAAALYARHRVSWDTDHLLPSLVDRFDGVRERLEQSPEWRTARVQPPVLILGTIGGIQVGFRQMRHQGAIETTDVDTPEGALTIPTLDEMIGMKAYMIYGRNATRDYIDFAALSACAADESVVTSLLKSDDRYGHLQSASAALEIAKRLSDPAPYDLSETDLTAYKGLVARWQVWDRVAERCRYYGAIMGRRLILGG